MSSRTFRQKKFNSAAMSPKPPPTNEIPSIDWWVTSRCNLSCDYCFGPKPTADPAQLRESIAIRISRSPARAVTFCGGEPLLVRDLPHYAELQQASGKTVVLNTNGELLRRRFRSWRSMPFDVVGVSIDGSDSRMHRSMRGANADLDKTLASIRWLRDQEPEVKIKIGTVVSAVNADRITDVALLVRRLEPDVWRLYQYSPWGPQNHGLDRHRIATDDFVDAVQRATDFAAPIKVSSSTTETTGGCLIIDPRGRVLTPLEDGYEPIGNCLDEQPEAIWSRAPHQEIVKMNKRWLNSV